ARRVARAGLRNRRAGVPLPKVDIAGYGADARGAGTAQQREHDARRRGDERARTARELFTRELDAALDTLQDRLPAGRPRLTARDFTVTSRGRARLPGGTATTAPALRVGRTELGRQATIAIGSPGHAAAVEVLDAARRDDPVLRPGRFEADAVARRVLRLAPYVLVDPEMRRDLYAMVRRAAEAGRASGVAALTAFHLAEEGVLAADRARHLAIGGTRVPGLNWTGPEAAELNGLLVEEIPTDGTGTVAPPPVPGTPLGTTDLAPWPWDATPYAVLADGGHDRVTAALPDGTTRDLDADAFAELVAADPALRSLPDATPIVLAVPFAGDRYLDLPRTLADRTGRTVWVHTGVARRHPDPASGTTVAVLRRSGKPHGSWLAVAPGLAPGADGSAPAWHRDVLSQPVVSDLTGRQIGRSLHDDGELVEREDHFGRLDRMTVYAHYNPATRTYSAKLPLEDPGPKDKAYHLAGHGLPGRLLLPLAGGGSRPAGRHEAGEWLRRRKSLSSLPEDHWIDLVVCHSSAPRDSATQDRPPAGGLFRAAPFAADPLADDAVSLGQHLANVTGRTVRLSHDVQGAGTHGDDPARLLWTDVRGRRWWWETSRPEPGEAELDRLAAR
ncbi:Ovarian tumor otubain, partial [Streptomyces coelicoflavus ZG0656]